MTDRKRNRRGEILFDLEEIEAADQDMAGFCIACGAYRDGYEPDAREYECEECGESKVYGAGEIAIMGLMA